MKFEIVGKGEEEEEEEGKAEKAKAAHVQFHASVLTMYTCPSFPPLARSLNLDGC